MRVVLQRVRKAQVTIEENKSEEISQGILVLLGIEMADTLNDVDWLVNKVLNLRIFDDEHGVMNKSLMDSSGSLMVVSQFTLWQLQKREIDPPIYEQQITNTAIPLYESFIEKAD
jgi:D-tyrosyl-tRNA(Tyr) deacylase